MINLPDPYTTVLPRWAAELALQDPLIPRLTDERAWQHWAAQVLEFSSLQSFDIPNPNGFLRWQDWGARVKSAVEAGT